MRRRRVIAVASALVTSGCLRFQDTSSETATTRPAPFEIRVRTGDDTLRTVLTREHVETATTPRQSNGGYAVFLSLTTEGTARFRRQLRDAGVFENRAEKPLPIYLGEEKVGSLTLSSTLARSIQSGEWQGTLQLVFEDVATARRVSRRLPDMDSSES